jgi:hypothetical protein
VRWINKLVGATLKEVYLEERYYGKEHLEGPDFQLLKNPDYQFPVLVFQCRDRSVVFAVLQCDGEGNGPGWLELVDREGELWEWPNRAKTPQ